MTIGGVLTTVISWKIPENVSYKDILAIYRVARQYLLAKRRYQRIFCDFNLGEVTADTFIELPWQV